MVAEIFAGLSAFKTMFDMAKALKDINDATIRNGAVIELQEQILSAQSAQSRLVEHIRELEKEVADLKAWDADKKRYEMVALAPNIVAYAIKESMRGTEPPHYICANCYSKRQKSHLQQVLQGQYFDKFRCNECEEELIINKGRPPVYHAPPEEPRY